MENDKIEKKQAAADHGPQPDLTAKIVAPVLIVLQMALLLYVVWNSLTIIEEKKEIRLRCALYDPYDFMKGRYIRLNFTDLNRVDITKMERLKKVRPDELKKVEGRPIYCILQKVEDYHVIKDIFFEKPDTKELFIKLNISHVSYDYLTLRLHFNHYYLQEDFAVEADKILRGGSDEEVDLKLVMALGKSGKAVQKDFLVNDTPIIDYIKRDKKN